MNLKDVINPEDIERLASALKPWKEMLNQSQQAITALADAVRKDNERLSCVFRPWKEVFNQYQQAMTTFANAAIPYIVKLPDIIKEIEQWDSRFKKAFFETGWIMSPSAIKMPTDAITESVFAYLKGDKTSIDRLLVEFFSENNFEKLDKMINTWHKNEFIMPRLSIIKAAVNSYKQDEHYLSIPALLAQIEGASYEICVSLTNSANKKSAKPNIRKLKVKRDEGMDKPYLALISEVFIDFIESYMYKTGERDKSMLHVLNRPSILHGHDYNYASKENALRCLLILDCLTMFTEKSNT